MTTLTNQNGELPSHGYSTIPIALDPFSTAAERCTATITPEASEWLKAFLSAPVGSRPTLQAYPGYEPPAGRHAYYWDEKTMWWRETITDAAWMP